MKKFLIILAGSLTLAHGAAAQSAGAGAAAGAQSAAQAGAAAGATAGIIQQYYTNGVDENGNAIGTAGNPLTTVQRYEGQYEIKNVPSVSAPGIITAHNCALGASGGASGSGFGISLGGSYVDEACQRINEAAALNTLVGAKAAVTHLARGNQELCLTLRSTGNIPANSLCTDAEKRAAAKAAKSSRSSASQRVAVAEAQGTRTKATRTKAKPQSIVYQWPSSKKCEARGAGRVAFQQPKGMTFEQATLSCQRKLGL